MTNEELYDLMSKGFQDVKAALTSIDDRQRQSDSKNQERFASLEKDVAWIRGNMVKTQETKSDARARRATWIAVISVAIAVASLIKGFATGG